MNDDEGIENGAAQYDETNAREQSVTSLIG